jgi:hypothetical protein
MLVPIFVLALAAVIVTLVSAQLFLLFAAWSIATALAAVTLTRSTSLRAAQGVIVFAAVSCAATTFYAILAKGSELLWFAAIPFGIAAILLAGDILGLRSAGSEQG